MVGYGDDTESSDSDGEMMGGQGALAAAAHKMGEEVKKKYMLIFLILIYLI